VFGLARRSESLKSKPETYALEDAAKRVLEIARKEKLPLAYIAARGGEERAQYWFANNLLHVVSGEGRRPDTDETEILSREKIGELTLDDDMRALRIRGAARPTFVDLRVSRAEFARYVEFVRTTQ